MELTEKTISNSKESSNSLWSCIKFKKMVKLVQGELENNVKQDPSTIRWSEEVKPSLMLKESSYVFSKSKLLDHLTSYGLFMLVNLILKMLAHLNSYWTLVLFSCNSNDRDCTSLLCIKIYMSIACKNGSHFPMGLLIFLKFFFTYVKEGDSNWNYIFVTKYELVVNLWNNLPKRPKKSLD